MFRDKQPLLATKEHKKQTLTSEKCKILCKKCTNAAEFTQFK